MPLIGCCWRWFFPLVPPLLPRRVCRLRFIAITFNSDGEMILECVKVFLLQSNELFFGCCLFIMVTVEGREGIESNYHTLEAQHR